jgi:hypothetical protein
MEEAAPGFEGAAAPPPGGEEYEEEEIMDEPEDAATDVLGSGSRYKSSKDIRSSMTIASLSKSFDKAYYFGAKIKGRREEDRNTADLEDWTSTISSRIDVDVHNDIFGGTVLDFLRDPSHDPQIVEGTTYYPAEGDGWFAFKANRWSVAALEERKKVIRKWVHGVVLNFSVGYWRDMTRTCADKDNGQTIVGLWKTFFMEDEVVNVAANAEKLRGDDYVIVGAEDPSVKLSGMLSGWSQIQKTAFRAAYGVPWFCAAVAAAVGDNPCYSVFRQSGGLTKLLGAAMPQDAVRMIRSCWVDNHKDWNKTMSTRVRQSNASRANAYPRRGNNKNNGRKNNAAMNNDVCSNCKRRGHTFEDCRMENGGRATKCYNCNKFGHMARDCRQPRNGGNGRPHERRRSNQSDRRTVNISNDRCDYRRCDGNRSSHSTKSCPAKQRDDARSRANDPRQANRSRVNSSHKRDLERRRRFQSPSSSDDDSGNDSDMPPPTRRIVKRSRKTNHSRPSTSLADDDDQE